MKKITFIKQLSFIITFFCAANFGFGQTTLSAGDIVITGVNSTDPDQFSFVLLTDVLNGTQINFTDEGWQTSGSFRGTTEGVIIWTATSDLPCGTQIIVTDNSPYSSSIGTVTDSGLLELSATAGDQLLAYQGLSTSPTFIYAIHFGTATTWTDAVDANTSAIPSGLFNGVNAIYIGNLDNGIYDCSTTSDTSLILAAVSDANNWSGDNNIRQTLGGCYYSCVACSGGTVTWNGSWSGGTPDLTTQVIIADYYDTETDGSFSACSLHVTNGAILNVSDNSFVEVQNDITVDSGSELFVQSQGAVVQIDDLGNVTNNSIMTVSKKTAPANAWYEYTYWSSPVKNETIGNGLFESQTDRRFSFTAQNFLDATKETGNNNATVAGQDDIDDDNNDWQWVSGSTVMQPGIGYASTHDEDIFNSSPGNQIDYSFEGPFNNGVITVPLYRNNAEMNDNNWNFIGNPYPSAISANLFLAANSNISTDIISTKSINGAIFLWSQNTPPSSTTNGNQAFNFSNDDYAIINAVGESAGGDGVTPSRLIPSGQGFFVSMSNTAPATVVLGTVYKADNDVVFNNSMRVKGTTDNSQFFKNTDTKGKSSTAIDNKLWINLTSDNGAFNQILVGYVNGATNNDDGASYDAAKYPTSGSALYTTIEGSSKKFAIQGKDANSINEDEIINLGFKTSISVATLYKLSVAQLEGDFLTCHTVYLKDNLLNKVHNLSAADYTFTSEVGEFNNRFEITFKAVALSANEAFLNSNSLKIIELQNDFVQFTATNNLSIKTVNIYDLLGRQLYSFKGNNTTETYKLSNLKNSIYIAKVELSNGTVATKKAVKK